MNVIAWTASHGGRSCSDAAAGMTVFTAVSVMQRTWKAEACLQGASIFLTVGDIAQSA